MKLFLKKLEEKFQCSIVFLKKEELKKTKMKMSPDMLALPILNQGEIYAYLVLPEKNFSKEMKQELEKFPVLNSPKVIPFPLKGFKTVCFFSLFFISPSSERKRKHQAFRIHLETSTLAFLPLTCVMKENQSFKKWANLFSTTLFIENYKALQSWQKNQVKQYISSPKTPLSPKLVIGVENNIWRSF